MNLPAINNKMKNHNNQFKPDPSSLNDGFGLGIQVFKIQSVKNFDNNKSKNRTAIKNIENPTQTHNFKPPILPKPKRLPSLEKSNSQINPKQRLSAFLSTKNQTVLHNGFTDKIMQRKHPNIEANTTVTPVSYSMRKKIGVSTQKTITINQTAKPLQAKNFIIEKQKPINKHLGSKLNQTAPPQSMYKPQQLYYQNWHRQHQVLIRFYSQFQNCQNHHLKQIKQLKKLKENSFDRQIYDRIDYLQSLEGKVSSVLETMEKQQFDQKVKQMNKNQDKKLKRMFNSIIPISGFQWNEMDCFQYDTIDQYQLGDYSGSFKINNYDNVDLAPVNYQAKDQEDDQQ